MRISSHKKVFLRTSLLMHGQISRAISLSHCITSFIMQHGFRARTSEDKLDFRKIKCYFFLFANWFFFFLILWNSAETNMSDNIFPCGTPLHIKLWANYINKDFTSMKICSPWIIGIINVTLKLWHGWNEIKLFENVLDRIFSGKFIFNDLLSTHRPTLDNDSLLRNFFDLSIRLLDVKL